MSAVLLFSDKIAKNPEVCTEVTNAVKKLAPSLRYSANSPEALRVFLILPVILRKKDHQSDSLLSQLAQIILDLETEDRQILESLWSSLDIPFFKDLVDIYQRISRVKIYSIIEQTRNSEMVDTYWNAPSPLLILQVLYEVNSRTGFKIQERNFYVPEVKEMLCAPKLSPTQNFEQVVRIFQSKRLEVKPNLSPNIELIVRRQYLVQDTWMCLRNMKANQFLLFFQTLRILVVAEECQAHPGPEMEKHVNGDCNGKQQTVETEAGCACASLGKVFIHTG
uniref:Uncharacterized protein n=1 Tax=Sphaerodactylus townsendi TaxID=933632 RepID=A0ACB8E8U8_9SAUR